MNKYPKAKKNQVALILIVTGAVMVGLWFGLIGPQQQGLERMKERKRAADAKFAEAQKVIRESARIQLELQEKSANLAQLENGMASGDLYSWAINTIRQFRLPYKIDIPQFSQIDGPKDSSILAQFPYKEATLTVGGTGTFNDFGRFVADFENAFPHIRLQNLTLEPAATLTGNESGKLSFKMDIITLVKVNPS